VKRTTRCRKSNVEVSITNILAGSSRKKKQRDVERKIIEEKLEVRKSWGEVRDTIVGREKEHRL
jgi:hypothetical protein